jgi:hypothetical protein
VGEVLTTGTGGSGPFYLVERGGLAPLSVVQADLTLADPDTRTLYPNGRPAVMAVPAAEVARVFSLPAPTSANELPSRPPPLLNVAPNITGVCVVYPANGNGSPTIRTLTVPPSAMPAAPPVAPTGPLGAPVADQVRISGGDGLVAEALGQSPGATVFVITNQGVKYPLTDISLLSSLGLAGVTPVRVPGAVLSLLRTGPTLDQSAAKHTITP